jgi:pyridoxal 5'-phosphate synthase pdxS subunit
MGRPVSSSRPAMKDELCVAAKELRAPYELVKEVTLLEKENFPSSTLRPPSGVATPADTALMMQLGLDGVFIGSGIFQSEDPAARAAAIIVQAVAHYKDPKILIEVSPGLGPAILYGWHLRHQGRPRQLSRSRRRRRVPIRRKGSAEERSAR